MTPTQPDGSREAVWRRYDAMEARLTAPLSARMLELAGLGPGMRVLDLATGRGEPAIAAARRVSPGGRVLGVELSAGILEMARERAAREGVTNLDLRVGDAAQLDVPPASFDCALIRWGLMYLHAPVAALVGVHRALVPGGRLVAAVWAEPERVPYFTLPRRVLARYRAVPPLEPDAPGVFHYADRARLTRDLEAAGFEATRVEELDVPIMEAATPAELVAWVLAFGLQPLVDELPDDARRAWEADLVREAEPLRGSDGSFRLGGVTRLVLASRRGG